VLPLCINLESLRKWALQDLFRGMMKWSEEFQPSNMDAAELIMAATSAAVQGGVLMEMETLDFLRGRLRAVTKEVRRCIQRGIT
jgi:hypothetical protein